MFALIEPGDYQKLISEWQIPSSLQFLKAMFFRFSLW
jgi:hypothetical protein